MGFSPISFSEIRAFNSMTHGELTAWEVGLIRRIDQAVASVVAGSQPDSRRAPQSDLIPATDTARVKAHFHGVAERIAARTGQRPKKR